MAKLDEVDVRKKRVLLRVDFDVPIKHGQILDDYRIWASLPTFKYLLDRKAAIIGLSHIGRPEGQFIPELSLKPAVIRLAEMLKKYDVSYSDEITGYESRKQIAQLGAREIFFLGNIRFDLGEEEDNLHLAHDLASFADIYINDAFADCHRSHTSVHAITQMLPSYPGLHLESELEHLQKLLSDDVAKPFVVVLGGKKGETKIPTLKNLLPRVDKVLIGGAIGNTFLKASGERIGLSVHDAAYVSVAEAILNEYKDKILLPTDWVTDKDDPVDFSILDIGPNTISSYQEIISGAKTIFWNGSMGMAELEQYTNGTFQIADAITKSDSYSVAAGGDTIYAIRRLKCDTGFDFISTGGGATLSYLAGEILPGLKALGLQ